MDVSCNDCRTGTILPGEPVGKMRPGAYLTGPDVTASERAVVLLTDIFGLPLVNCKIVADRIAKELECDVWIPDIFDGNPILRPDQMLFPDRAGMKMSFMDIIKLVLAFIPRIFALIQSRPSVVDQRVETFIKKIKDEREYEKIGAVGYCFGGAACMRLGSKDLVDSLVICHPGSGDLKLVNAIKVPTAWVCAQDDFTFGADVRDKAEAIFAERKGKPDFVDYEFKTYPGTAHGFAMRPNLGVPAVVEGYEKSFQQTVEWFQKTLVI